MIQSELYSISTAAMLHNNNQWKCFKIVHTVRVKVQPVSDCSGQSGAIQVLRNAVSLDI